MGNDFDFGKGHQSAYSSDDEVTTSDNDVYRFDADIDNSTTDSSRTDIHRSDDDSSYMDRSSSSHEETNVEDSFNTTTHIEDSNFNSNNEYTNDQDLIDLKGMIDVF